MKSLPRKLIVLGNLIRSAEGRAMLVGGCVRDELMGVPPKDWDLEVYGIEPNKLKAVLESFADILSEARKYNAASGRDRKGT